ncbi:hypothetical protein GJAV_G00056300 [Gymnothorax javanicus]|nr:hypothetical protein GJAV_G00056300 [Gymnothorax javanicus]
MKHANKITKLGYLKTRVDYHCGPSSSVLRILYKGHLRWVLAPTPQAWFSGEDKQAVGKKVGPEKSATVRAPILPRPNITPQNYNPLELCGHSNLLIFPEATA